MHAGHAAAGESVQVMVHSEQYRLALVDDNPLHRQVLGDKLTQLGVEVITFESGGQFLEDLERLERPWDMVVVDYLMPAMDGIQTIERMDVETLEAAGTVVCLLTADSTIIPGEQANFLTQLGMKVVTKQAGVCENMLSQLRAGPVAHSLPTQRSVDEMIPGPLRCQLEDLCTQVCQRYNVEAAAVSLVGLDRVDLIARSGAPLEGITHIKYPNMLRRKDNLLLCHYSFRRESPVVILDASQDKRLQAHPLVVDHPRIAFYAAKPISLYTNEGGRVYVGALCMMDRTPRDSSSGPSEYSELSQMGQQAAELLEGLLHDDGADCAAAASWLNYYICCNQVSGGTAQVPTQWLPGLD